MSTHTPGPWRYDGPDCFMDYNILPADDHTGALAGVVNNGRPPAEVAANARLMAAAPELLVACEMLLGTVRQLSRFAEGLDGVAQGDAAIANALAQTTADPAKPEQTAP